MSEAQAIPEPWGDEEDEYYDVALYVNEDLGDDLQGYDYWRAAQAVVSADALNERDGTTAYRAVKVRRRTQWEAVKESDR
jgi:hypothetical protein